jgi:alkylation response protein AidB-like acyl-CoA dehydrogenase
VDFKDVDRLAEYRQQAREWVERHVDPGWAEQQRVSGSYHTPALHALLAEQGWLGAGWPAEYGGTDNDPDLAAALFEEIDAAGVHTDGWITTKMISNTLLHTGTEEQKRTIIGGVLRGEIVIVLGYTEPESGSDVAAAKTRAELVKGGGEAGGDEWMINGQKMFTSTAHLATHAFMLTRSNPDVAKHKGLTTFLVPLDGPGVEIRAIHTLGGQRTNATFYSDVRVPDSARIGPVDGGWGVMHVALVFERSGGGGRRSGSTLAEQVAHWAQRTRRDDGTRVYDDPTVKERLARIAIEAEVSRLLGMRTAWVAATGGLPGTEGSAAKLFSSESAQRQHWDLLDILGAEAVLKREAGDAPLDAAVEEAFRRGVVGTIYGGSTEIMREIVAERVLGLPRIRARN